MEQSDIDRLTDLLNLDKLDEWASQHKPRAYAGNRREAFHCPVANYLHDHGYPPEIGVGSSRILGLPDDLRPLNVPLPIRNLVDLVDEDNHATMRVTFGKLRQYIARVRRELRFT